MDLVKCMNDWSSSKLEERLLKKFGGLQTCPWCEQTVQSKEGWSIIPWNKDPMLDVITCGPCGGTSLWRFEMMFIYIGALEAPVSKYKSNSCYDIEKARYIPMKERQLNN